MFVKAVALDFLVAKAVYWLQPAFYNGILQIHFLYSHLN
jgi:hypothetical protein